MDRWRETFCSANDECEGWCIIYSSSNYLIKSLFVSRKGFINSYCVVVRSKKSTSCTRHVGICAIRVVVIEEMVYQSYIWTSVFSNMRWDIRLPCNPLYAQLLRCFWYAPFWCVPNKREEKVGRVFISLDAFTNILSSLRARLFSRTHGIEIRGCVCTVFMLQKDNVRFGWVQRSRTLWWNWSILAIVAKFVCKCLQWHYRNELVETAYFEIAYLHVYHDGWILLLTPWGIKCS